MSAPVVEALCRLVSKPSGTLGHALGAVGIVTAAWPLLSPVDRERISAALAARR